MRTYEEIEAWKRHAFASALAAWYDPNCRPFPWRASRDAFYVTVCEVLLQRTNAEKVAPAAKRLFSEYPTPNCLAEADLADIAAILQPLGLPQRVQQVRDIAAAFATGRRQDRELTQEELSKLMGVGPYVLAAVRVIALGERDAVIDEHVLRIFRRVFSVPAPTRRHPTKGLVAFARELVPLDQVIEYNLGILDLGRLVCRPSNPRCFECPVQQACDYGRSSIEMGDDLMEPTGALLPAEHPTSGLVRHFEEPEQG